MGINKLSQHKLSHVGQLSYLPVPLTG